MNCRFLLTAISFLFTLTGFSQNSDEVDITNIMKVNIINPGLSYEQRIGKLQSLHVQAYMSPSFGVGFSDAIGTTSFFYIDPAVNLQYRYYYNARRRQEKGKRTEMNSLNYIGPVYDALFSKERVYPSGAIKTYKGTIHRAGALWGFQRNYPSRFALDLAAGPVYLYSKVKFQSGNDITEVTTNEFDVMIQIRLGFWLNKRDK